ncbi:MAG: substrate-binding domain-containing protein [Bacteroidales bacterium]|nr:substrate-binding domain-containing protein [Bacteroidales bacterium]
MFISVNPHCDKSFVPNLTNQNYDKKDISVAGFSNYPVSTIIEPALTTIDDHAFEMGKTTARLLIRQIEDRDVNVASETIVIKTDFIVRDSTKRQPVKAEN